MLKAVRESVLIRDMYTCQRCHRATGNMQIAHRIKDGSGTIEWLQKKFTDKKKGWLQDNIVDHPLNLVTACSLRCNDSFNIFNNEVERELLVKKIYSLTNV